MAQELAMILLVPAFVILITDYIRDFVPSII